MNKLLFALLLSIIALRFDLNLVHFFLFGAQMGYFGSLGEAKNFFEVLCRGTKCKVLSDVTSSKFSLRLREALWSVVRVDEHIFK